MDSLGTEIGQKMRSAVKAKLIELGTGSASGYIDDELPDYVMIMVANKRSRQQMIDDLSLFLGGQTEVFVNWLHQVLQKLQEVTLPASAAAKSKEGAKKKSSEPDDKRKDKKRKEKKTKRRDRSATDGEDDAAGPGRMSASDDNTPPRPPVVLPAGSITEVFANQYIEKAKKSLDVDGAPIAKKAPPSERSESRRDETKGKTPPPPAPGPSFDIPSIVDITSAAVVQKHHKELCELKEIEQRISEAKRHLRSLGTDISDEDDEDLLHLKASEEDLRPVASARSNQPSTSYAASRPLANKPSEPGKQRQRITMGTEEPVKSAGTSKDTAASPPVPATDSKQSVKKRSVLDRLGTKVSSAEGDKKPAEQEKDPPTKSTSTGSTGSTGGKSTIISLSAHRREEREIYVPLYRRKETVAEEPPPKAPRPRPTVEPTTSGGHRRPPNVRHERDRSHERMNRTARSPPDGRRSPKGRFQSQSRVAEPPVRSRESTFRRSSENPRPENVPVERRSRARERSRSREWPRDRSESGAGGRMGVVKNGTSGEGPVRSRIGSRVIVLPPKADYSEDVVEVPVASVIKVQPRPVMPKAKQPSKNLLLKAMAEAQRSTVANLKKTIDNSLAVDTAVHRVDIKRKLLIEIPGAAQSMVCAEDEDEDDRVDLKFVVHAKHREELLDDGTTRHDGMEEVDEHDDEPPADEEEEVHEVDIGNEVLMEECDVDEEFKEILDDGYNNTTHTNKPPQPPAPPAHDREVEEEAEETATATVPQPELPMVNSKDTKFVVTLDGAFKASVEQDTGSPSHTPPPPPSIVQADVQAKARMSVKARIGFNRVAGGASRSDPPRKASSPNPIDAKEMEETLKKRKERFSEQLIGASAATTTVKPASKAASPVKPENSKRSQRSSSRSTPRATSRTRRQRTPTLSPEPEPPKPRRNSRSRTTTTNTTAGSPSHLNELLLQRTKELMDDSVSSSPIYMSKSDYDKMEPASRKRKRVSPIQFDLTDEDERHDSDDDYHHHHHHHNNHHRDHRERDRDHRERERRARSREDHHLRRSRSRDSEERATRKESRREWEREGESHRDGRDGGRAKSPGRKIKKLESSRKFDDIPPLLSAVALAGSESKGGTIKERCKYFPNCRQGDACEFLHPSTPCKAFPGCKYGDMCLYLHPMCKYDTTCHRLNCNFMHTKSASSGGLSAPPLASSVVPVQNYKSIITKPLPPVCKFYPNCVNTQCQYLHPKMCRFGKHCVNKIECNFYHYDIPAKDLHDSKDKFKWISPFTA